MRGIIRKLAVIPVVAALALAAACSDGGNDDNSGAKRPAKSEAAKAASSLAQFLEKNGFSGAALIAADGKVLLRNGYGDADRMQGVRNTADTKFCIASMGKMFTGVAIAQLVADGKLSFTDPIGKYLTGFPPEIADRVTVEQLLTHTAGFEEGKPRSGPAPMPPDTIAGMLEQIRQRPLAYEPGSRFAYSNDGYIILGALIEQLSGQSYADYVREHIFEPAGMTDTEVRNYRPNEIDGMAYGYMSVDANGDPLPPGADPAMAVGELQDNADRPQIASPAGGAYSTVDDLFRFAQALTDHKLLNAKLTEQLLSGKVAAARPGGPADEKYGYGFAERAIDGSRVVGHNGGTPGYESQLDIYLDEGYVVVLLANQDRTLVPAHRESERLFTGR